MCFLRHLLRNIANRRNPMILLENLANSDYYLWLLIVAIIVTGYLLTIDFANKDVKKGIFIVFVFLTLSLLFFICDWVVQKWKETRQRVEPNVPALPCGIGFQARRNPYNVPQNPGQRRVMQAQGFSYSTQRYPLSPEFVPQTLTPGQYRSVIWKRMPPTIPIVTNRPSKSLMEKLQARRASTQRMPEQSSTYSENLQHIPSFQPTCSSKEAIQSSSQSTLRSIYSSRGALRSGHNSPPRLTSSSSEALKSMHQSSSEPATYFKQPQFLSPSVRQSVSVSNTDSLRSLLQSPRYSMASPRGFFKFARENIKPSASYGTSHGAVAKQIAWLDYGPSTSKCHPEEMSFHTDPIPSESIEYKQEPKEMFYEGSETDTLKTSRVDKGSTETCSTKRAEIKRPEDISKVLSVKISPVETFGKETEKDKSCSIIDRHSSDDSEKSSPRQSAGSISGSATDYNSADTASDRSSSSPEKYSSAEEELKSRKEIPVKSKLPEKFFYKKCSKERKLEPEQSVLELHESGSSKNPSKSSSEGITAETSFLSPKRNEPISPSKSDSSPEAMHSEINPQSKSGPSSQECHPEVSKILFSPTKRKKGTSSEDDEVKLSKDKVSSKQHRTKIAKISENTGSDSSD